MISLALFPLFLSAAIAQDGTCTSGLDAIGVEQSCLGRCHIYYEGNYGACNSYQVSAKDASGPCGDSIQNPCISTFNGGWDPTHQNCGNCYYVEMAYEDGSVRSTYLKTIDTNGSETKFEMSQTAWTNLCPYLCAGTGTCGNKPEACQYGVQQVSGMPAPCAVQNAPITFKRVDCNGSSGGNTDNGGNSNGGSDGGNSNGGSHGGNSNGGSHGGNSNGGSHGGNLNGGSHGGNSNGGSHGGNSNGGSHGGNSDGGSHGGNSNGGSHGDNSNGGSSGGSNIAVCENSMNPSNAAWKGECKRLCTYYTTQPIHCPDFASGVGLTACVKRLHAYCA